MDTNPTFIRGGRLGHRPTQKNDHVEAQVEVVTRKAQREASGEKSPVDLLMVDFQPPEL